MSFQTATSISMDNLLSCEEGKNTVFHYFTVIAVLSSSIDIVVFVQQRHIYRLVV